MNAGKIVVGIAALAALAYSFLAPDAGPGWMEPKLARIIFWHLPCAFLTSTWLFTSVVLAWRSLRGGDAKTDVRLQAAQEIAFTASLLTITTGILFSRVQWGAWWNWDPQQTAFLVVVFLLAGTLVLRGSISEDGSRRRSTAIYQLAVFVPAVYLIFVHRRLFPNDLHPEGAKLDIWHWSGVAANYLAIGGATLMLYARRVRVGLDQLLENEKDDLAELGGDDSTGDRVVRPVDLRPKH